MLCLGTVVFAGLAEWRLEDTHAGALTTDRGQYQRDSVHSNLRTKSALGRDEKGRCTRGSARRWVTWVVIIARARGHAYK
jgi:hypothetical protein